MIFKRMRELAIEKALKGELIENNKSDFASDKSDCLNIDQQIDTKWQWFKLPELVSFKIGKTPYRGNINYWKGDVPWVAIADITASNGHISNTAECITELAKEECFKNNIAKAGSLLMSFKLSIGKMAILDIDAAHNEAIISMTVNNNSEITKKFLFYFLPYFAQKASKVNAVKGPTLNKTKLLNLRIACPEIREQELIVRKLDIVFAEIYRAEKAYEELQSLANVLRCQILQKAIQGKLVPQLPDDGVVEQIGDLPAELPFEIPDSWKWGLLENYVTINPSASKLDDNTEVSFLPMASVHPGFVNNFDREESKLWANAKKGFSKFANGDVLIAKISPCFENRKSCIVRDLINGFGAGSTELITMRPTDLIYAEYLLWYVKTKYVIDYCSSTFKGTVGQQRINPDRFKSMPIPVPPLAEQKRIVSKVETLLEQIDLMTK